MTLRLRGNAWYLKKTVTKGGRKVRREFPLKVFGGEPARKKAEAAAKKLMVEIDRAEAAAGVMAEFGISHQGQDTQEIPTLTEWWGRVKQFYSAAKDHHQIEHWLTLPFQVTRTWGAARLDEIKKSDCLAALATRRKHHRRRRGGKATAMLVSEQTVQRGRGFVQAILQRAVDDEIIGRNPWTGVAKPAGNVGRRNEDGTLRLLEPAEETKLLNELAPRIARWVRFVLLTGLRKEGATELRQEQLVTRAGAVYAHVSEKSKDHNVKCPTCGRVGKKCREVPLVPAALAILQEQIAADGQLWHQKEDGGWLDGIPSLNLQIGNAAARAGIHRVSPHDLRFTFGHRYLTGYNGGTPGRLEVLSRVLGHSSIRVTERHYAYLKPNDLADEMNRVMGGKVGKSRGGLKLVSATT